MEIETLRQPRRQWVRGVALLAGITILGSVYLFQRINLAGMFGDFTPGSIFIINRTLRLILNDIACFLIIWAIFGEKKYLKIAFLVFLVELFVILPAYLVIKLTMEGDSEISSPLLSQVHRLIVNPTLMILLMAGFVYQRFRKR